jgi:hypothetical protein
LEKLPNALNRLFPLPLFLDLLLLIFIRLFFLSFFLVFSRGEVKCGLSNWKQADLVHLGEELSDCQLYLVRLAGSFVFSVLPFTIFSTTA